MTQQPKTEWPDWLTALKRDMPCGCNGAYGRCTENNYATGWNDCIDHLTQRGMLQGGWMPIESAPRDGTTIRAYDGPRRYRADVIFNGREWEEVDGQSKPRGIGFYPTHWMPLPAAPKMEGME